MEIIKKEIPGFPKYYACNNGEIWCTGSYPSCIDRLADVAWRVSMVRTTYGGSSVVDDYPCPKMPFADFSEEQAEMPIFSKNT